MYSLAIAVIESALGRGWSDERCPGAGTSNNWGAIISAGGGPSFACVDRRSDGSVYSVRFRSYPTAEDGAADVVRQVIVRRPKVVAALSGSGASAYRASYAMRRSQYFAGLCPTATSTYGAEAAQASFANPDRDEGTKACARQAISSHAQRAAREIQAIAVAIGEPPLQLGTYEDADAWWRAGAPAGTSLPVSSWRFGALAAGVVGLVGGIAVARYGLRAISA